MIKSIVGLAVVLVIIMMVFVGGAMVKDAGQNIMGKRAAAIAKMLE